MGNAIYSSLIGLLVGLLLVSCQRRPANLPELDPNIPTRVVEHAMGASQVPMAPERIVVIDTTPLDAALALGIQPVGTIRYGSSPGYLGDVVHEIDVVGQYYQPNLETILRLSPDLILGAKSVSEGLYPKLSRIAPAVFIEGAGYSWDWKNNFRLFAEAMGKSEQAEQLLTNYQQQLENLRNSIEPPPKTIIVSVLIATKGELVAHTSTSFSGSILEEIGFTRNSTQDTDEQFFVRLSREDLEGPDGDLIFLIHNPEWKSVSKADFVTDRLWSQLKAVRQNTICEVTGDVWASGRSILAAHQVLENIRTCLDNLE